nr:hypothetical protein [Pedobacter sp. ASV2]
MILKQSFTQKFFLLCKQYPTLSKMGLIYTSISLFILIPGILLLEHSSTEDYQRYNFDSIEKNGSSLTGRITKIEVDKLFTVNDEHPTIIYYTFILDGKIKKDRMKVLDIKFTSNIKIGDRINVKLFNGESKIKDVESFSFPFYIAYIVPLIFLTLGIIFLTLLLNKRPTF